MPPKKTSNKRARSPEKAPSVTQAAPAAAPAQATAASTAENPAKRQKSNSKAAEKATDATAPAPASAEPPSGGPLTGCFDLYSMHLPFLKKAFRPASGGAGNYQALYDTILTFQAKPDRTAQCALHDSRVLDGKFYTRIVRDPFDETPYDLVLEDLTRQTDVASTGKSDHFRDRDYGRDYGRGYGNYDGSDSEFDDDDDFDETPDESASIGGGPGVTATVRLAESPCGVASTSGVFKLKEACWTKTAPDGKVMALFEGYFSCHIKYGSLYSRKGHGRGQDVQFPFWAVRARKDENGVEIDFDI